jgi:hypothetical protein
MSFPILAAEAMIATSENGSVQGTGGGGDHTALIFAIVSLVIYVLFLRPTRTNNNNNAATQQINAAARTERTGPRLIPNNAAGRTTQQQPFLQQRPPAGAVRAQSMPESAVEVLKSCLSKPPHVKSSIVAASDLAIGGSNILMDGMVAFSSTHCGSNNGTDETAKKEMVRERAKILSQLFRSINTTSSATRPPSKGSTLVVGLSEVQLSSSDDAPVIAKVLSNLASNYTLLLIVQVDSDKKNISTTSFTSTQQLQDDIVQKVRGLVASSLLDEVKLPSHRILLSSSSTGRIALVRQLATVEIVVDFDPTVQDQLERFGYKVAVVQDWMSSFPWLK